jgi:hypothetical protein
MNGVTFDRHRCVLRTFRQTYDHRGPEAFDEDTIVQICGRERLEEAMTKLEAGVEVESIDASDSDVGPSVH